MSTCIRLDTVGLYFLDIFKKLRTHEPLDRKKKKISGASALLGHTP